MSETPQAALCNPCREGTPTPGCETCAALAAMIRAAAAQYFPDANLDEIQVHMAGTPPWEREGWEGELADDTDFETAAHAASKEHEASSSDMHVEYCNTLCFEDGFTSGAAWQVARAAAPAPPAADGPELAEDEMTGCTCRD